MSSSMFIEGSLLPSDTPEYASNTDSNLVVVYGKNGISFDDKGLENLIERKISSISVIRLTSPTPSMEEEDQAEAKLEDLLRRQELDTAESSDPGDEMGSASNNKRIDEEVSDEESSGDEKEEDEQQSSNGSDEGTVDGNKLKIKKTAHHQAPHSNIQKQKNSPRKRTSERPEIVGLRLEEFYPPEDANEIIKEVLKMAGLGPDGRSKEDYEFQLLVIKNDHCYTPFTSPSQMKAKLAADKLEMEKKSNSRKSLGIFQTTCGGGKQFFVRKKSTQKQESLNVKAAVTSSLLKDKSGTTIMSKVKKDCKDAVSQLEDDCVDDDSNVLVSNDEGDDSKAGEEDGESECAPTEEESDDTDNDRDSDLDFDVNNPKGKRRKIKALKCTKRSSAGNSKLQQKTRRFHSQEEPSEQVRKPPLLTTTINRYKSLLKNTTDVGRITVRSTPTKIVHAGGSNIGITGSATVSSPAFGTATNIQRRPNEVKSNVAALLLPTTPTSSSNMPQKTFLLKSSSPAHALPPQHHKEIIINKQIMSSPKTKGFTDLNTLIEQTEKEDHTIIPPILNFVPKQKSAYAVASGAAVIAQKIMAPIKGFMPIGLDTAAKNQLPSQISIHTHQSSSELEAEHDKQLDLINSIVQDEMKKPNNMVPPATHINKNIPELVKMLESTENVLESTSITKTEESNANDIKDGPGCNNHATISGIDIANANLLSAPDDDDELPDDILQLVDMIQDEKTLQEAVKVFSTGDCNETTSNTSSSITSLNPPPLTLITTQQQIGKVNILEDIPHSSKSIIQMSISNLPSKPSIRQSPIVPSRITPNPSSKSPLVRKEPIQIIRGNGRVITLPPIEAPTTRAKRRAQAQPTPTGQNGQNNTPMPSFAPVIVNESSLDYSVHSNSSVSSLSGVTQEKKNQDNSNRRRGSKESVNTCGTVGNQKTKGRNSSAKKAPNKPQTEPDMSDSGNEDDDDPNKLWCICRQPHNNRFMICCDACEDWFHGTCVNITKAMGLEMEQKGIDWTCPKCVKKQEEKKQPKITDLLIKKPADTALQIQADSHSTTITSAAQTVVSSLLGTTNTTQTLTVATKTRIHPGQFINLKELSSSGKKVIIQAATSGVSGQKKLFVTTQPLRTTSATHVTPIRTIAVVKHISSPTTQTLQNQSIKVIKTIPPPQSTSQNVVTTAVASSTPNLISANEMFTLCIVCQKSARANSIYCSDDCIRKHAQNALHTFMTKSQSETTAPGSSLNKNGADEKTKKKPKGLFEDLLSMADRKPKVERVNVYERKSGRILTGSSAPTISNLKKWLQENPTFEVVQPGSAQALDIEKRQKLRTQHSALPTVPPKSVTSPPPLKLLPISSPIQQKSDVSRSNSPQTYATPTLLKQTATPQSKPNKGVVDFVKSSSPSTVSRPSPPKQLQKHPQHGFKCDKSPKQSEDAKPAKEKLSITKRQVSAESVNNKPANQEGEPIRLLVRRTLKEQLLLRMQDTECCASTPSIGEEGLAKMPDFPKLTSEEIEEFAKTTELEMYNYFNRDAGMKYKAKYRSLIFNIKDRKNHTLFAKICGKKIEPKQLVRMTPDEMASQELAQWREQENKHQLEMIKKSELDMLACAKNYVLKTHKGEEVIESKTSEYENVDISIPVEDVLAALNKTNFTEETPTTARSLNHWPDLENTPLSHSNVSESNLQSLEGEKMKTVKDKDKDREKDKDRQRDRERNREGREKRHKSKDRHRDKSRSRKRSRSRSRSRSRERSEKRHKIVYKDERRDREKDRFKDRSERDQQADVGTVDKKTNMTEKKTGSESKSRDISINKRHQQSDKLSNHLESYNLVDQILESTKTVEEAANLVPDRDNDKEFENIRKTSGTPLPAQSISTITTTGSIDSGCVIDIPAPPTYAESDQEPTSTVSIPTPPHDPYARFMFTDSSSFADGSINRCNITTLWTGDINMVDVASFHLSIQPVLGNWFGLAKLLAKELDVVGRIGPETVWDYISKIKKSPNKEIVIIRLIPASESETSAYKILYEYLDNRNRLGVVKSVSPYIKDFYIYPLGAGKLMPIVLRHNEPVEFYDDPCRPDMLVGILVRVVGKRHNPIGQSSNIGAATSSTTGPNKLTGRTNENDSLQTPPGSPKQKKRRQSVAPKDIDIDAIIKAPIVSKSQKGMPATTSSLIPLTDADEPYSPGGSSDDDLPLLPVKLPVNSNQMQTAEDELKRKMEEINRQIAAQEMEIAGLLTGDSTKLGTGSAKTSKVLANIAIPSNLSQILASIKPTVSVQDPQLAVPPPPPLIGSLIRNVPTSIIGDDEYNPAERVSSAYDAKCSTSSSSRLANLSEAELLSMVPDDIAIAPKPQAIRYEEPPPPGV